MKQKEQKKPRFPIGWIWAVLLAALGLLLYFGIAGFSFSGCVCWGIAAVIICYELLRLLGKHHRGTAKALRLILTICLCLGITAATVTGCVIARAAFGSPEQDCEYVVVLGAGVNGTVPSLSLRERLNAAYDYLVAHPQAVCVVSGGQGNGEDITEAQCMFNDLTNRGIAPERVWMEDRATNTRENIRFSLELIEEKTGARPTEIGLVSSEYHLYRAGLFAGEQDVTAVGIPAETSWISLRINYFLREIVAVWYYFILGG